MNAACVEPFGYQIEAKMNAATYWGVRPKRTDTGLGNAKEPSERRFSFT